MLPICASSARLYPLLLTGAYIGPPRGPLGTGISSGNELVERRSTLGAPNVGSTAKPSSKLSSRLAILFPSF